MTCPCYFLPGFGTQQLHPRGPPRGTARPIATRRTRRLQPAPTSPALPRGRRAPCSGLGAGGSQRAARKARAGVGGGARLWRAAGEGKGARLHSRARGRQRGRRCVSPVRKLKGGRGRERPGSSSHPETDGSAGNDEGRGLPGPCGNRFPRIRRGLRGKGPQVEQRGRLPPPERAAWVDPRPCASRASISRHPAPPSARAPPRPRLAGRGAEGAGGAARLALPARGLEAPSPCFTLARSFSGT